MDVFSNFFGGVLTTIFIGLVCRSWIADVIVRVINRKKLYIELFGSSNYTLSQSTLAGDFDLNLDKLSIVNEGSVLVGSKTVHLILPGEFDFSDNPPPYRGNFSKGGGENMQNIVLI